MEIASTVPRRTADDRIRRVTLYGLRTDPRWWLREGRLTRDEHARISGRARSLARTKASKSSWNTPLIFSAGFMAVMFVFYELSQYSYPVATTVGGIGFAVVTAIVIYRNEKDGAVPAQLIAAFLEHRRCPSCAQDLSAVMPVKDGCTECPGCAAAWLMPTGRNANG